MSAPWLARERHRPAEACVYYNKKRAHTGHVNRGLPPHAWLALYNKTPGDHLGKLVRLGVIKFDGDCTVRMMDDNRDAVGRPLPKRVAGPERCQEADGLPFALVLERVGAHGDLSPTEVEHPVPSQVPPPVNSRLSLS